MQTLLKNSSPVLLMILIGSSMALATTGTITKVSGKRAIVQFEGPVKTGDTVTAGEATASDPLATLTDRKNSLAYSVGFSSLSVGGTTSSSIPIYAQYNFIKTGWEWGIIGGLNIANTAGTSGTGIALGGIAQYDFKPNKPGTVLMPAAYGKLLYATTSNGGSLVTSGSGASVGTGGGTASTSGFLISFGGLVDYFLFSDRIALTANLEYLTLNLSQPTSTTISGLAGGTGFRVIF